MMRPYVVTQASGDEISKELFVAAVVLIVAITLVFVGLKTFHPRSRKTRPADR
jgi:hypothetical protein